MKKYFIKYVKLVLCMLLFPIISAAQLQNTPVLFYAVDNSSYIYIEQFINGMHYELFWERNKIKHDLLQNINYYENYFASGKVKSSQDMTCGGINGHNAIGEFTYRRDMSDDEWIVYSQWFQADVDGYFPDWTSYLKYKRDYTEFWWCGTWLNIKRHCVRIRKDDILRN